MRSAIITGGRKGLGFALAKELAMRGWRVFSFSRSTTPRRESSLHWLQGDVTDAASLRSVAAQIATITPSVELLINNAGEGSRGTTLEDVTPEELERQFNVHCLGVLRCVHAYRNLLLTAPMPLVMNITSRFGSISDIAHGILDGSETSYGYRVAKASQNMLTQCLVHDPALKRISFIAVNPGQLITDSAAQGANRTPQEASKAICDLLDTQPLRSGMIIHAFGGQAGW